MPLTRTIHWATRELNQYLLDHADDEFVWGKQDCCLFAANAILSFTGTDLAADFRGKYDSQLSAFRLISTVTNGGTTAADAAAYCAAKNNLTEYRYPALAKRGDLVVLHDGEDLIAGVVHLNGRHAVTIGKDGLRRYPLTSVTRAWEV